MNLLNRSLPKPQSHPVKTLVDFAVNAAGIKCVRDRGLDHAVAREKNLRPVLSLKDLIKSEPSKSLPLSYIAQQRDALRIPIRPIEFIRSYPSIFQEFLPGGIGIQPHIKLSPEMLNIDAEEQLVYQSESFKQSLADRLLKLLMISRMNKIPLRLLDAFKWDLGLPLDYLRGLVPEFPDYFRVINSNDSCEIGELELVCWSHELAVSHLEEKEKGYTKGKPIAFPMHFSKNFEMDKKVKKWIDEWQKLPYVSPYENVAHLPPKSDESDKWAAAVLHEILNLFVTKRVDRESILYLGEYLGVRSRLKRALLHHPGVFYISSKLRTQTVVLREAYKRGILIETDRLINIRNQYINLMGKAKEDNHKVVNVPDRYKKKDKDKEKDQLEVESLDIDDEEFAYRDSENDMASGEEDNNDDKNQVHRHSRRGSDFSTRRVAHWKDKISKESYGDAGGKRTGGDRRRSSRRSQSRVRLSTAKQKIA